MIYFSKNIKILRNTLKYTQDHVADLLGVKPNTISNYERGISEPTINQIYEFIKIFDISADDLLFNDLSVNTAKPLSVSEPASVYKVDNCELCREKDRTILVLEELNVMLKERLQSKTA